MSKSTIGLRRSGLAALATTSLVMGAIFAGAGVANADADFDFTRIAGDDRYETSADIAEAFGAADTAILASGEPGHYPDALSANFLAGVEDAPVLLTMENDTPQSVLDRLEAAGVDNVIIVGGELAVSAEQEQALTDAGYTVTRESGQTRFDTNAEIIAAGANNESSDTALIATGLAFPDALAGGPAAYKQGMPIGLSNDADMPDQVIAALKAANVNKAIILGGELRVPASVAAELEANDIDVVTRLSGQSRSATAVAIAEYGVANWGFNTTGANVASGRAFGDGADALAGGPLTGKQSRPLLITENETTAGAATTYLEDNANTLTDGIIFGGELAITPALETTLNEAAQSVTGNQTFSVTPQDDVVLAPSTSVLANEGRREFTVSGLTTGTSYNLALVEASDVSTAANGNVSFSGFNLANNADIERVNGANIAPTNATEATAANGQITASVDSTGPDSVVLVVWRDADNGDDLDRDANGLPTEAFGVSGVTNYISEAADGATADEAVVTEVNKAQDYFSVGGTSYRYDSGDRFRAHNGTAVGDITMAQFEGLLTVNDVLDVTLYDRDGQSIFVLDAQADDVVAPATNATAKTATNTEGENDVVVSWTASTQSDVTYDVYRSDNAGDLDTRVRTGVSATTVTLADEPNGAWFYDVVAIGATSKNDSATESTDSALTVPVAAPGALDAISSWVDVNDADTDAEIGDVLRIRFDGPATINNTATLQVNDGAETAVIERNSNATFAMSADNRELTVTLTAPLTGIQYPATITAAAGIFNTAATPVAWDPAGDTDAVLEDNGSEIAEDSYTETAGEGTVVLLFNEALNPASGVLNENLYTFGGGNTGTATAVQDATLSADGRTLTLDLNGTMLAADTVAFNNATDDDGDDTDFTYTR